jgi:hypothetical protein
MVEELPLHLACQSKTTPQFLQIHISFIILTECNCLLKSNVHPHATNIMGIEFS